MIGAVRFAYVCESFGVAEHRDGLFELVKVLRADQHGRVTTVAGDDDAVMFAFDSVDQFGKVVAGRSQRLSRHATIVAIQVADVNPHASCAIDARYHAGHSTAAQRSCSVAGSAARRLLPLRPRASGKGVAQVAPLLAGGLLRVGRSRLKGRSARCAALTGAAAQRACDEVASEG